MPAEFVAVRRQLIADDHLSLREHMPGINSRCGDISIKWFRLATAACTLIERGEYQRACQKERGRLKDIAPQKFESDLTKALRDPRQMPTESHRLTAEVTNVDFLGTGPFLRIALILESSELLQERTRLTSFIDQQNGITGFWDAFEPNVALASIPKIHATDAVLDAFWDIAPEVLTFNPVKPAVT